MLAGTREAAAAGPAVSHGSEDDPLGRFKRDRANTSSPDAIAMDIIRGLYEGRFVQGQRLIEADLTRRLKVSRGPIREALRRLAADGIVELTLHKGAYIRTLSRKDLRDVLLVMEVTIGLAARLAAEKIDDANRRTLETRYEQLVAHQHGSNFADFARARNAFYRGLVRIGGNGELGRLLPKINAHLLRIQLRHYEDPFGKLRFEDYRQITDAVLDGDAVAAERAARAHIRRTLRTMDELPDAAYPSNPGSAVPGA